MTILREGVMPMFRMGNVVTLVLLCATPAFGQTITVGLKSVTVSSEPYIFDTAEQPEVKVSMLLKFDKAPYKLLFMDNGELLVVERGSGIRVVRGATSAHPELDPKPIEGIPAKAETGEPFELLDIALHPKFSENHLIYFSGNFLLPEGQRQAHFIVMSGKLENGRISDLKTLVSTDEASFAGGSRLQFGMDGKLYITTGAPFGDAAQRLDSIYGKILRVNDDGSIPSDNPFVGKESARGEIYTLGHRDQIGLAMRPGTGELITTEHGPNGGDEANLVRAGANYGWPNFSYGREYDGSEISETPVGPGTEKPLVVWMPSIAPSGLAFYNGDKFPAWKGNLFVTSARRGEINNTGGLERVVFNDKLLEMRRETLFAGLRQRFRDVVEGPDGLIYASIERGQNALLRIEPAPPTQ